MLRRIILFTVFATLACATQAWAQGDPFSGEPGRFVPQGGNGMWAPYGGYPPMDTPYGSRMSPLSSTAPGGPPPGVQLRPYDTRPTARTIHEFLPEGDVRGPFYSTSPFEDSVQATLAKTWVRVDYLNYNLTDPGGALLGSPYNNQDVRDAFDPATGQLFIARERDGTPRLDPGNTFFLAEAQDLSGLEFDNRNGIRGTIGFPTENGAIEASLWGMQKDTEGFTVLPRVSQGLFLVLPAITLTNNGTIPDPNIDPIVPMILFDDYMHVDYQTQLMGAEANYIRPTIRHNAPLNIQFLAGFKYVRLAEKLGIHGRDLLTQVEPRITSETTNHIFGPNVGLQIEWEHANLKFGAESRLTFAFNRHENTVAVADLFQQAPNFSQTSEAHTDFAPMHDAQIYAQLQLTHRLKVRVGYNILRLFGTSRPFNNIVWDDSGVIDNPNTGIRVNADKRETFQASGLFVSGEWSLY